MTEPNDKKVRANATDKHETLQVRCSVDLLKGLDDLRREHPDLPTRATMARIVLENAIERQRAKEAKRGGK